MKKEISLSAKNIALIAIMSAILITGKFALSFIPNVEVVTTLLICFAVTFKWRSVFASVVFCIVDAFIYTSTLDVIVSYFIYWNLLAITVSFLSHACIKKDYVYLIVGVLFTASFGFLTSFTYHLFYGVNFWAIYSAGLVFYALQIISTVVFMLIGFSPITRVLIKIKEKLCI